MKYHLKPMNLELEFDLNPSIYKNYNDTEYLMNLEK
jgi:hypothetical protein